MYESYQYQKHFKNNIIAGIIIAAVILFLANLSSILLFVRELFV